MDEIDRLILEELEENGRKAFTEIADKAEITEATIRNRVEKMQDNNVISGFTVERGEEFHQSLVEIKVEVGFENEELNQVLDQSSNIYEIAGEIDFIVKLEAENRETINKKIDEIRGLPQIKDTRTLYVVNEL